MVRFSVILLATTLPALTTPAFAADFKPGDQVFLKETAEITRGKTKVDRRLVRVPATVEQINGAWLWVGRGWIKSSEVMSPDEAFQFYSKLVEAHADAPGPKALRGAVRLVQGDYERAIIDLNRALESDPKQAMWLTWRADAYAAIDFNDDALADYRRATAAQPLWATSYIHAADFERRRGDYGEAAAYYAMALRFEYSDPYLYLGLGDTFLAMKEYSKADSAYSSALRLDPILAPAYAGRGESWLSGPNHDEAIKDYTRALKLMPTPRVFVLRGQSQQAKGLFTEALADYSEALKLDPNNALAHMACSWLYATCPTAEIRNAALAVEHGRKACELTHDKDVDSLAALAAAYAESGEFPQAVEKQSQAIALAGDMVQKPLQERLQVYKAGEPYRTKPVAPAKPVAATKAK